MAVVVRLAEGVAPALLAPPVNVARLLLHPHGMGSRIVNLDEWGWHVITRSASGRLGIPTTG